MTHHLERWVGFRLRHLHRLKQDQKAAYSPTDRRNFALGIANGALFDTAMTFLGAATVMPAYVSALSGSRLAVGVCAAILLAGWPLPQLFFAPYIRRHARAMGLYRVGSALRCTFLVLTVVSAWLAASNRVAALWVFIAGLTGFSLAGGMAGIAFTELVARTVPSQRRGGFYSRRLLWGGVGGLGAGWIVRKVLAPQATLQFPTTYAVLFFLAWLFSVAAVSIYALVHEAEVPPVSGREKFSRYLQRSLTLVKADKRYIHFLLISTLSAANQMAVPFYSLYLLKRAGAQGEALLGTFVAAQVVGGIVSNLFWGRLGDQRGSQRVLYISTMVTALVPAWALCSLFTPVTLGTVASHTVIWGTVLFALLGSVISGNVVASNTYLLDISPLEHRTTYIGLTNTFSGLYGLYPILGGIIAELSGPVSLFTITLILQLGAIVAVRALPVRDKSPSLKGV